MRGRLEPPYSERFKDDSDGRTVAVGSVTPKDLVPGAGVEDLLPGQLDLIEAQLDRQEDAMAGRVSASSTRSAVLIGASAVLAGAEFATSPWSPWLSGAALALYLGAAIFGLSSAQSKVGVEPLLPAIVAEYAENATISLRRELVLARLRSHAMAVHNLAGRHQMLVIGFWVLGAAWALAAAGTVWGLMEDTPTQITEIRIVK